MNETQYNKVTVKKDKYLQVLTKKESDYRNNEYKILSPYVKSTDVKTSTGNIQQVFDDFETSAAMADAVKKTLNDFGTGITKYSTSTEVKDAIAHLNDPIVLALTDISGDNVTSVTSSSISQQMTGLYNSLKSAVAGLGITVPENATLDDIADLISAYND